MPAEDPQVTCLVPSIETWLRTRSADPAFLDPARHGQLKWEALWETSLRAQALQAI